MRNRKNRDSVAYLTDASMPAEKEKDVRKAQASDGSPLSLLLTETSKVFLLGLIGLAFLPIMGCSLFGKSPPPSSQSSSSPPSSPPPLSSARTNSDILTEARQQIQKSVCCGVVVKDFQDGVLHVEGYIDSEEQRQKIRHTAGQIAGIKEIKDTTAIIPHVFRQAIDLLTPFQAKDQEAGSGTRIEPQKGCNTVYSTSESLVLDISLSNPGRYVYADYYVADHELVAHLFPNPFQSDNFLKTDTSLILGGEASPVHWEIQPPFGLELLTVIVSSQPLFDSKRMEPEGVTNYLAELRKVLPQESSASDVEAAYCLIQSQGKDANEVATISSPQQATTTASSESAQEQEHKPSAEESPVSPQGTSSSSLESAATETAPSPSVDFLDVSSFDSKLSSVLKDDPPEVTLNFTAPVSLNSVPPRLDKWFATVEHHGGTVALKEDPKQPGPTARFLASLGVTLAVGAYEYIKNKLLYGPAKDYNATVYYVKSTGTISKVVFTHK